MTPWMAETASDRDAEDLFQLWDETGWGLRVSGLVWGLEVEGQWFGVWGLGLEVGGYRLGWGQGVKA